uniref:Uncharacterized protein n=1 Tax=Lepeophtheirus salmonis TaxID=72036 RepID=A0A0K2UEA3_LEPSM
MDPLSIFNKGKQHTIYSLLEEDVITTMIWQRKSKKYKRAHATTVFPSLFSKLLAQL